MRAVALQDMVRLTKLSKRFGPVLAVDEVSFAVGQGEVLGFLGPNGAGKSTTMRMVTGFIPPTSGTASVMGHDILAAPLEAKRQLGYLPEGAPAYGDMSVVSFLRFIAAIRGLRGAAGRRAVEAAIERASLTEVPLRPIEALSKGYKRRVGIAQAILHDPPVLILDEPTDGLDPNQKHEMRGLIAGMAKDKAIIISTHILEEVEAICTRAIVIAEGRIVADAHPGELKRRSARHNAIRIRTQAVLLGQVEELARGLDGVREVRRIGAVNGSGTLLVVPADAGDIAPRVTAALHDARVEVEELVIEQGHLDEVFRELTAGGHSQNRRRPL
jgi:ABC-2 type transport system ATP-binding protein